MIASITQTTMLAQGLLAHEQLVRLAAFFAMLVGMAVWEILAPRRALSMPKAKRWTNNLAILLINSVLVRVMFPAAAVGFAAFAESNSLGLLHVWNVPEVLAIILSVAALDFAIYLQHIVFHAVPALWQVHRVHHADLDFDVTTGTRFHPIEILLSMAIKFLVICMLGPPVVAVLVFETLLNVTAMFNHSNICLPGRIDGLLRRLLITPDMHRIHHSTDRSETNSNFGFCFSVWDRMLGTYRATPRLGHAAMQIGVAALREPERVVALGGMLVLPFASGESTTVASPMA
jgi:sterol desaturase/sphingolipid hydroxylase (fatty acid hydroxylase superfamily)